MNIYVPIPFGSRQVAIAQGAVWRVVNCTSCQERFAYRLVLRAKGEDFNLLIMDGDASAQRAKEIAKHNLECQKRDCVRPVPCPTCSAYQPEIVEQLKDEPSINRLQVIGGACLVVAVSLFLLSVSYIALPAALLAVTGSLLIENGYKDSIFSSPNDGDPEPRRALGRSMTIWCDQLETAIQAETQHFPSDLQFPSPGDKLVSGTTPSISKT